MTVKFAVALRELASTTFTTTVVLPGIAVRLPEMIPVLALIESVAGSAGAVLQVNGATPPVTFKSTGVSAVYCWPLALVAPVISMP